MLYILQTGLEKNLFGNHPVSLTVMEPRSPPPAFASDPIMSSKANPLPSVAKDGTNITEGYMEPTSVSEIMEIESPSSTGNFIKSSGSPGVRILWLIIESKIRCICNFLCFSSRVLLVVCLFNMLYLFFF